MLQYKSTNVKACLLCQNRSNVTDSQTSDPLQRITYHKLPVNAERRDRWLEFCGLSKESFASLGFKFICSNHFEPECFERDLRSELLDGIKRMILKKDALPTIRTKGQQLTRSSDPQQDAEREREKRKAEVEKLLSGEIPATTPILNPFRKHICQDRSEVKQKANPLAYANAKDGPQLIGILPRLSETEMLQRIAQLERETGEQGQLVAQLQRTIDKKTEQINLAKAEMVNIAILLQEIKKHENERVNARVTEILSRRFSKEQLKVVTADSSSDDTAKSETASWSDDDLAKALELRCISEKAFRFVLHQLNYPLPDGPQIERWIHGVYLNVGSNPAALRLLELHAGALNRTDRICLINLTRTNAPVRYYYDRTRDQIIGPDADLHSVAVQGLFANWIQIVRMDFDQTSILQLLENIIAELHRVGYHVVGVTMSCDRIQADAWHELGISNEQHFIAHPVTGELVYVFICPDSIFRAIHRTLVDDGIVMQQNNVIITKDTLQRLLELVDPSVARSLKFNQQHLCIENENDFPTNSTQSRELISHSTTGALKTLATEYPQDDTFSTLGTLFDIFIDWYELCTTTSAGSGKYSPQEPASITTLPYGACEDEQNIVLDAMYDVMENVRCINAENNYLPQSILISINSTRKLLTDLRQKYPDQINDFPTQRLGLSPICETMNNFKIALRHASINQTLTVHETLGYLCHTVRSDTQSSHVSNSLLQLGQFSREVPPECLLRGGDEHAGTKNVEGVTEQDACSYLTKLLTYLLGHKYEYLGNRMAEIHCENDQYIIRTPSTEALNSVEPSALWTEQAKVLESYVSDLLQTRKSAVVEGLVNYIQSLHPRMGRDLVEMYVSTRVAIKVQSMNAALDTK